MNRVGRSGLAMVRAPARCFLSWAGSTSASSLDSAAEGGGSRTLRRKKDQQTQGVESRKDAKNGLAELALSWHSADLVFET